MQSRLLTSVVAIGLLSLALLPTQTDARDKPSIAVVLNGDDLSSAEDAIFSPDRKLVAIPDSEFRATRVTLWSLASGQPLRTLEYDAFFTAVVFAPNGAAIVSGHRDGSIKTWNVETGAVTATLQAGAPAGADEDADAVRSLWIDDGGKFVVAGDHAGVVTVWDMAQRKRIRMVKLPPIDKEGNHPRIVAARLSADRSSLIAFANDSANDIDSINWFDMRTGAAKPPLALPKTFSFAKDGAVRDDAIVIRHAGADCGIDELLLLNLEGGNNPVSIYKPATCEKAATGEHPATPRLFWNAGPPQLIAAQEGDPELTLWDLRTRRVERTIKWPDNASAKRLIGVSSDFSLAAARDGSKIHIRNLETGELVRELMGYRYPAENAIVSTDGRSMLLSRETSAGDSKQKEAELWKVDEVNRRKILLSADTDIQIYDFSPGAMVALGAKGNEVILFSLETGREQRRVPIPRIKDVSKARLSPDGKMILVVGEAANAPADDARDIGVLVDAADQTVKAVFEGRDTDDYVMSIAFSPDGKTFAVGRRNGTAEIFDVERARRIKVLPASKNDDSDAWTLRFSEDGRLLMGSSLFNEDVYMWDVAAGRLTRRFELGVSRAHYRHAAIVAVSHDRKLVAGGLAQRAISSGDVGRERGQIKVWDAATGMLRFTLRGHEGAVFALAFSPDDRWIVSGSFDGTIRYWDRATGNWMATFMATADDRWIVSTRSGFFAGSEGSENLLTIVRGLKTVSGRQVREQLYRPDPVGQLIKGDERRYRAATDNLKLEKLFSD